MRKQKAKGKEHEASQRCSCEEKQNRYYAYQMNNKRKIAKGRQADVDTQIKNSLVTLSPKFNFIKEVA